MEQMLTTKEYAEYTGIKLRTVKDRLKKGTIPSIFVVGKSNKEEYRISITELSTAQQLKYFKDCGEKIALPLPQKEEKKKKSLETLSEAERKEMAFWVDLIEKWQSYRNQSSDIAKAVIDERFIASVKLDYPDLELSDKTLYRKWSIYKENRWEELVDTRGKHRKGKTKITKEMMDTLLYYYLDQSQHPVSKCYDYMKMSMRETNPEQYEQIPSEATFRRHIKTDVSEGLKIKGREGNKAFDDKYGFYIAREYENMNANEYWIGDTHTLDIQSRAENGSIHRLYLSAWMDARSGVMTGWHIASSPSSQTSILALRDGIIRRNCIPENIYVDNGREFLTHDFGGIGHRGRKSSKETHEPPTIIKRLGINMTNALVQNARAKTIERRFLDFKNQISRLFSTYTGGNVVERPEILKANVKNGNVVIDEDLISNINNIMEYYFNYEAYGGKVAQDKEKRKIDVYHEYSKKVKMASQDDLNLMLMRSTRVKKIGRRGISIEVAGEKFDYSSQELKEVMFGQEAYLRYDPYNLATARVYDVNDAFIMEVPCVNETILKYGASAEDIKASQRVIRLEARRNAEQLKTIKTLGLKTAQELVLAQALENKKNAPKSDTKIIEMHRAVEEPLYQQVSNGTSINLNLMNQNAKRKNFNPRTHAFQFTHPYKVRHYI